MDNPFDAALACIYEDEVMAVNATWTSPAGGAVVPVRVIFFERPRGAKLDSLRQPHDGPMITCRACEPFAPEAGGVFAFGLRSFRVRRFDRSRDGREYLVEVEEASS